jgi:RES domain-containing protein
MTADLDRLALRFDGVVYRAHHPGWAYQPTSGEGAERHGGRFNRKGLAALYTSLDINTAWMEAQQGFPFKAQPMTLVGYRVCCERIADLADAVRLAAVGIDPAELACAWEDLASRGLRPPTWQFADSLIAADFQGALVPSFAPAPNPAPNPAPGQASRRNLVLWRWADGPPCAVSVIDDFGRLPNDAKSWVSA